MDITKVIISLGDETIVILVIETRRSGKSSGSKNIMKWLETKVYPMKRNELFAEFE